MGLAYGKFNRDGKDAPVIGYFRSLWDLTSRVQSLIIPDIVPGRTFPCRDNQAKSRNIHKKQASCICMLPES
jgi:hypothetical protein